MHIQYTIKKSTITLRYWALVMTCRNSTCQGEGKEERTSHWLRNSSKWRRECMRCLCILASFRDNFIGVKNLSGKEPICWITGRRKVKDVWIFPLCNHLDIPGCGPEVEGSGLHCLAHQLKMESNRSHRKEGHHGCQLWRRPDYFLLIYCCTQT